MRGVEWSEEAVWDGCTCLRLHLHLRFLCLFCFDCFSFVVFLWDLMAPWPK